MHDEWADCAKFTDFESQNPSGLIEMRWLQGTNSLECQFEIARSLAYLLLLFPTFTDLGYNPVSSP